MTTSLFMHGRSQAVRIPSELRLPGKRVSVRRFGAGILIEPIDETEWPKNYFEDIRIHDPEFRRPDQGELPEAPRLHEA
ncbi:MAG: AbrB/MazE/SpoVT family DNA-binding domain-containing protein [Verrucomicrobia bacterium]|nr:AbrB/MazE/SpoVT family DNA-binding domain-containing protein [Verrucomicrobiota bacterium]